MIFLQNKNSQERHCFQPVDLKQHRRPLHLHNNYQSFKKSLQKQPNNDLHTPESKNSHGNKLRPLIKIHKNLENAFPQNFFQVPNPSKPYCNKKTLPAHRKCYQFNLQQAPFNYNHEQIVGTGFNKYQSTDISMSSSKRSPLNSQDMQDKKILNRFQIKSLKSSRTSIQKKHDITFSFDTDKLSALPQTAETLQNIEEEDLFNLTFGNGFSKETSPNLTNTKIAQENTNLRINKIEGIKSEKKSLRLKNFVSLQLKRNHLKSSNKQMNQKHGLPMRVLYEEGLGSMSERKTGLRTEKQLFSAHQYIKEQTSNPFIKIKFDMDEILRKKTSILPTVSNKNSSTGKRQRLSKHIKLGC